MQPWKQFEYDHWIQHTARNHTGQEKTWKTRSQKQQLPKSKEAKKPRRQKAQKPRSHKNHKSHKSHKSQEARLKTKNLIQEPSFLPSFPPSFLPSFLPFILPSFFPVLFIYLFIFDPEWLFHALSPTRLYVKKYVKVQVKYFGWWFQPLWKILVNGKDYPIHYGK